MVDEYPEISGITNAREAMKKMPEPDRARIAEQVSTLRFLTTFECKNINMQLVSKNWFGFVTCYHFDYRSKCLEPKNDYSIKKSLNGMIMVTMSLY